MLSLPRAKRWWFDLGLGVLGVAGVLTRLVSSLSKGQLVFDWHHHNVVFYGWAAGAIYAGWLAIGLLFIRSGLAYRRRDLRGGA